MNEYDKLRKLAERFKYRSPTGSLYEVKLE